MLWKWSRKMNRWFITSKRLVCQSPDKTQSSPPEGSHDVKSRWGKRWRTRLSMQEVSEVGLRSLGQEGPLEEGTASHCGIRAWRIPWTEGPGRLQSMGLQRVGYNWVTNTTLLVLHLTPLANMFRTTIVILMTVAIFVIYLKCKTIPEH